MFFQNSIIEILAAIPCKIAANAISMCWRRQLCINLGLLCGLHKPTPDVIPLQGGITFKEQVSLLTIEPDGISVPLAAHLHGSAGPYIGYPVDLISSPILPHDLTGQDHAVIPERSQHLNVHFFMLHRITPPCSIQNRNNRACFPCIREKPAFFSHGVNIFVDTGW